nr:hypothetical protein [Tanacetum cinerariifolium]
MGDENPIRNLRDYSRRSHEGYRNIIELRKGNNVVPLRSDTISKIHLHMRGSYYSFPCSNFPLGRTVKLRNDILMFQQHQRESLSEAWTRFKDLLQKVPHHGIDLCLQLHEKNTEESWALLEDLALYDNESWNDPRDFVKSVKAISLPQDVPSTSDRRLIELKNQVQHLMEAHLAPKQPIQVNKITSSCEISSGPNDTQYCMEDLEQDFVNYASSRTNKAGGKWYTFKPEQNNIGDTYNPSWKSNPNLRIGVQLMASQDARLSKFEADFKQQQSEMTNKIDTVLKAIIDRMMGALPSDTVKNQKLNVNSTSLVLSARESQKGKSENKEQEENDNPKNINTNPSSPPNLSVLFIIEKVRKLNSFFESFGLVPQSSDTEFVCTKWDDGDVMFIEIIKKNDDSHKEELKVDLEREHTKSVYFRNEKDKRRRVEYVISKILRFYKECLELGPEYLTGFADEGEVTLYLIKRSLEVLRKFHCMILKGRFNKLSHVSSPLLSKPGEY